MNRSGGYLIDWPGGFPRDRLLKGTALAVPQKPQIKWALALRDVVGGTAEFMK
jgi:hypothetical protein